MWRETDPAIRAGQRFGSAPTEDADHFGDAVNAASRMADQAKARRGGAGRLIRTVGGQAAGLAKGRRP